MVKNVNYHPPGTIETSQGGAKKSNLLPATRLLTFFHPCLGGSADRTGGVLENVTWYLGGLNLHFFNHPPRVRWQIEDTPITKTLFAGGSHLMKYFLKK